MRVRKEGGVRKKEGRGLKEETGNEGKELRKEGRKRG